MTNNPIPLEHGRIYHVYNRGVNRERIFCSHDNYRYFLNLYVQHVGWLVDTYAYCLLSNHFHFLLRVKEIDELQDLIGGRPHQNLTGRRLRTHRTKTTTAADLSGLGLQPPSQYFSNFFNAYARAFNPRAHRTGALFQRPFGRIPVTTDAYFAYLVVYIHQNPQKHGFVDDYRDWPYSSYQALASDCTTRIDRATVLGWMGGRDGFDFAHRQDLTQRDDPSEL
jgi:REP element-mobilizing transposase RayT